MVCSTICSIVYCNLLSFVTLHIPGYCLGVKLSCRHMLHVDVSVCSETFELRLEGGDSTRVMSCVPHTPRTLQPDKRSPFPLWLTGESFNYYLVDAAPGLLIGRQVWESSQPHEYLWHQQKCIISLLSKAFISLRFIHSLCFYNSVKAFKSIFCNII